MKRLLPLLSVGLFVLLPFDLAAQVADPTPGYGLLVTAPHFFIAVVAGVVLALAFQFLLTNLSFAAGLSSFHFYPRSHDDDDDETEITGKKITTGIGVFALVTASLALFFASWLAVELSLAPNLLMGMVLGLVVWGVFYLVLVFFETSAMASLVGTITSTALSGLRTAYEGTTGVFRKKPEDQAADIATEVTRAIHHELARDIDTRRLKKLVDDYVGQMSEPAFTPDDVSREIVKLLDDVQLRSVAIAEGPSAFEIDHVLTELESKGKIQKSKSDAVRHGVSSAIETLKREQNSSKGKVDSSFDAALQLVGMERREAEQMRHRLEEYLRRSGIEALDPDELKRDLAQLVSEPNAARESIAARLRAIDRDSVVRLLSQRQDLSDDQAQRIVDTIMSGVERFRGQLSRGGDDLDGRSTAARRQVDEARERLRSRVRGYVDRMHDPALDYDGLEHDIQQLFAGSEERSEGIDSLKHRIEAMDRDTIVEIISAHPRVEPEQADRIVASIERAREKAGSRFTQARLRAERKMKEAKIAARKRAEDAREVVATAAWWAVASAVASGFAAALGGIVAVATGF